MHAATHIRRTERPVIDYAESQRDKREREAREENSRQLWRILVYVSVPVMIWLVLNGVALLFGVVAQP